MKNLYLLLFAIISLTTTTQAQCVVDNQNNELGITPPDSLFPAIIKGVQLDNSYVAQVYLPSTVTFSNFSATLYWITISNVTGFPSGITYTKNPTLDTIYGDGRQCIQLSGLTNAAPGDYPLSFDGFVRVNTAFTGDTTIPISLLNALAASQGGPNFGYNLRVVDPNGVNDVNSMLTKALQVSPNPSNGVFGVKLNFNGQIAGELRVVDITGKVVYANKVQADSFYSATVDLSGVNKGMYSVQLKTDYGVASKIISIE